MSKLKRRLVAAVSIVGLAVGVATPLLAFQLSTESRPSVADNSEDAHDSALLALSLAGIVVLLVRRKSGG